MNFTVVVIQVRDEGLDHVLIVQAVRCGCTLRVKLTGLVDELDVEYKRKRGLMD